MSKGALIGAPKSVVEVLSPSNSVLKLKQYRRLCFENGTLVFWTVDPDDLTVEEYLSGESTPHVWHEGEKIPLNLWGQQDQVSVRDVFR